MINLEARCRTNYELEEDRDWPLDLDLCLDWENLRSFRLQNVLLDFGIYFWHRYLRYYEIFILEQLALDLIDSVINLATQIIF